MKDKAIDALKQQIIKLDEKSFDLDAWKTGTIILLSKLFGGSSDKVTQISKLQLDFSSWTLRDTSGEGEPIDRVKKKAKDILAACITEIEIFGIPGTSEAGPALDAIRSSLQDHLRMQEYRQLSGIISSGLSLKEKQEKLSDLFRTLPPQIEREILISLLSHPALQETTW